jgi:hypothetical protein
MIDVAIVGGGVSGLWLLNRLVALGYDAHLYEKTALGTGQTIAAQGIIHGGLKYALNGVLPPVASSLAAMPERWTKCLEGIGEIDLRKVEVLSRKHELRLQNRLVNVPVWSFPEPVLCMKSLLTVLRDNCAGHVHLGKPDEARVTIYTAGLGNEGLGEPTQRRPLRMFIVAPSPLGAPVYLHWVGRRAKPEMTVTTHFIGDEEVLYLGGSVAERAVGMNDRDAIEWAISEAMYRFPCLRWRERQWAIHDVSRAEPQWDGGLPPNPVIKPVSGGFVAWPCKLAMAPVLADMLIEQLPEPQGAEWCRLSGRMLSRFDGDLVPVAPLPWESANWITPN